MTLDEALKSFDEWLDKNSLIKSQAENRDSGNGILYLSVAIILFYEVYGDISLKDHYHSAVTACFKVPGLLMRNPSGSFGLESWDDYLGVAVACIIIHDRAIPRKILWYGIKHFGCYNNTDNFTWASFLWRFPHVWFLLTVAAFPRTRLLLKPFLELSAFAVNPDLRDASGVQLAWVFEYGLKALGFKPTGYKTVVAALPVAFEGYYARTHFFQILVKRVARNAEVGL